MPLPGRYFTVDNEYLAYLFVLRFIVPRFSLSALCLLLFLLFHVGAGAQTHVPIPRFQTIGTNEGLSQSSVYSILQDRKGFMWFGTGDGLNRYDGTQVRNYFLPRPAGTLPSSFVRGELCEDDSGNIWFATEYGLHCWDARMDRLETRVAQLPGQKGVNNYLTAGCDGRRLWLFSNWAGVMLYDLRTKQFRQFPFPDSLHNWPEHEVHPSLDFGVEANRLIRFKRYTDGPFCVFDTKTETYSSDEKPGTAVRIFRGKGRSYSLFHEGVSVFDSATHISKWISISQLKGTIGPNFLREDRWGRAWISSFDGGLYCYDNASGQLFDYRHSSIKLSSLPSDLLRTLYIDRADNLWIGTDGGGVARLDLKPPRFHVFPVNDADYPRLRDKFIKCFYEASDNILWFGTYNDGVCVLDLHSGHLTSYQQYQSNGVTHPFLIVGAIDTSSDGNIWIAHTLGFTIFNPATHRFTDVPIHPTLPATEWSGLGTTLLPLKDGRMLGGSIYGLVIFEKIKGQWEGRSFAKNRELSSRISSLCQTPDGDIWFSASNSGLTRLQMEADSFIVAGHYFDGLNLRGLHPDDYNPNILWAPSSNGLGELNIKTGKFRFRGVADGMSNAYIYGVLQDKKGNLWLSTNGGLIYYDRQAEQYTTFTHADGLQSNEFNSGACLKGPSGRMYFGGVHGFNWFNPDKPANAVASSPKVALLNLSVNGQIIPVSSGTTLSLPYTQNNIAFDIAVLDYTRPKANEAAYFLEGWDHNWIIAKGRDGRYSNLPPGNYQLHIKGRNAAGIWSNVQTIHFKILAPFWATPLFYVLLICLAAILLFFGIRFLLRRKLNEQRKLIERQQMLLAERARISKDMHDEIGSGLTRIAMMSEGLGLPPERAKEARRISGAARSLSQNMSEIIWALNPSHDTLEELLSYLREQLNLFLEPFDIRHVIRFPDNPPEIPLSNVERRNLYLTAKEAVGNVLKHAKASSVEISVAVTEKVIRFQVCDNGQGFCKEQVRRSSNGLRNMQRRMSEIGGSFSCESSPNGTFLQFEMPVPHPKTNRAGRLTTFFTLRWLKRQNTFDS